MTNACPCCGVGELALVHVEHQVPVHSCIVLRSREAVTALPTGKIALGLCNSCGFVSNTAFDPSLMRYGDDYEESQGYSPTFRRFHEELAEKLDRLAGVEGKRVLEIGCGKGDFLAILSERGAASLLGFDPGYREGRVNFGPDVDVRIEACFFPPPARQVTADLVVVKMTLEHIAEPLAFLRQVRASVDWGPDGRIFLMVPDADRVWSKPAFEDVYYEHCSYFRKASLAACLDLAGFAVEEVWHEYAGQYLCALASLADAARRSTTKIEPALLVDAAAFSDRRAKIVDAWKNKLAAAEQGRVVLWGSGSKAVAFLSACRPRDRLLGVIDVNPYRHGGRLPPEGHCILAPDQLRDTPVELVVAMNAIYREEIRGSLDRLGLERARLEAL